VSHRGNVGNFQAVDTNIERQRRVSIELKYALISILVIAIFVVLQTSSALAGVTDTVSDGMDRLARFGSIGVFVIALVANVSIIIQIPYTLPLLSAALGGADLVSMLVLGVASGLGAGVGAVLAYKLADTVVVRAHAEADGRVFRWLSRNVDTRPRTASFVIFLVALSPLPDGTIVMPLAMIHYGLRRVAAPLFVGKFLHNILLATVFWAFASWADGRVSEEATTGLALAVALAFMLLVAYHAEKARVAARGRTAATPDPAS
jgi:hypothetical protein